MSYHGLCEARAASVPRAGGGGEVPPALTTCLSPRDEEIQSKCGIDATTYLSFQRHLLVLLMLVCVLSVAVILPVNFSGDLLGRCFPSCGCLRSMAHPCAKHPALGTEGRRTPLSGAPM